VLKNPLKSPQKKPKQREDSKWDAGIWKMLGDVEGGRKRSQKKKFKKSDTSNNKQIGLGETRGGGGGWGKGC